MSLPQAVALYNISQNCPQNTKVKVKILELPNPINTLHAAGLSRRHIKTCSKYSTNKNEFHYYIYNHMENFKEFTMFYMVSQACIHAHYHCSYNVLHGVAGMYTCTLSLLILNWKQNYTGLVQTGLKISRGCT